MLTSEEKRLYGERNRALRQLGFSSYPVYLQSALWASIRHKVLSKYVHCYACPKTATQVHHTRYRKQDLDGTCLDCLVAVCADCHRRAEFSHHGKLGVDRATQKLDQMRKNTAVRIGKADRWRHFFSVLDAVRIYLGMDDAPQARELTQQLDEARRLVTKKALRSHT